MYKINPMITYKKFNIIRWIIIYMVNIVKIDKYKITDQIKIN
jgi:hypothetical protein